jgi:zinc transporter
MITDTGGLIYAYLLNRRESPKALTWTEIDQWTPEKGLLWLHLDHESQNARKWLREKSGIDPITQESLLEEGTRPRNVLTDDGLLLILRGVNCNPGADPEDMVALRMLFDENRIITLRHRRVIAIQDIHKAIISGKGPTTAGDFLVATAGRIADRMGDVIGDIDDRVDELEDSILTEESTELRPKLADLRRKSISLRRYVAPQRDVLARLQHDRISWLDEMDRVHLREIAERTARFVEDIDSARERALITQEELNSRLSEQMNKAMYTLSIVAAIFLPLGLLTGLLGINVGGIPGTENKWAFTSVTIFLIVLAVGLIGWFRRIKWL